VITLSEKVVIGIWLLGFSSIWLRQRLHCSVGQLVIQ
jgi:hypothetical protein